nr:monofunctional riboflavin biosynthesis protein RIBA 3, chloroplastic isoform X1 [Tanacetum cinerariifolium]
MRHGSGIISVGMTSENLERLNLPLMSPENEHNSAAPSFTVTLDAVNTSIGVSSSDRAKTILALASPTSGTGDIGNGRDVLIRVHSECLTGDIFGLGRCDCGNQLAMAMQIIEESGRGELIYLRGHEGGGIGIGHKLRAYSLQDLGHDTLKANLELGFAPDLRKYGIRAHMLSDIGVQTMRLMTNNPAKLLDLKATFWR